MRLILAQIIVLLSGAVNAIVPTTDVAQQLDDKTTMANYGAQVSSSLGKINSAITAADQIKNLQGLQKLQAGSTLCELCTQSDRAQLEAYKNSINTDLCSQFSLAYTNITGIKTSVQTLQQIMTLFSTSPRAALMALQQASIMAQYNTNNTLAQMQMMQAQGEQKRLAEEKIGKQNHADAIKGATHVSY